MSKFTFGFEHALAMIKHGKRLTRTGWNGPNQWVSMTNEKFLDPKKDDIWGPHVKRLAESQGGLTVAPYLKLKNVHGEIVMGWTPTAGDLFANDWYIVEE